MTWQSTPFTPFLVGTAVAALVLGIFVHRRRATPGAGPAALSCVATAGWCAGYAMELSRARYADQLFWANIQYLFISAVPALMLAFALIYGGRGAWLSRRVVVALGVEPAVTVVLAFASQKLPLLRTGGTVFVAHGYSLVEWHYGPYFWLHTLYSYGLMLAATMLLVPVVVRAPHIYRLQVVTVVAGILAPWLANAVYIFGLSPFPHLDLTPFGIFFYTAAVAWGLVRQRFLDVVPVARHAVVEGLQEGVVVLGQNGRVADVNPAAGHIFGAAADDLVGRDPQSLHLALARALEQPVGSGELSLPGRDTEARIYEMHRSEIHDRRGRALGLVLVLHDVTERRRTEEERLRTQRLRAVGELAAGVAHNLNNILVGILAPAQRLRRLESKPVQQDAALILAAAGRARDLVRRMHPGKAAAGGPVQAVDVATTIDEAVAATRPRWRDEASARGAKIEVRVDVGQIGPAACEPSQLHDVLVNLIFNAVDAMPEGGCLDIAATAVGGALEIRLRDTGIGMDADTQRRVFEPFFTTKVDVGTGLGLATVHQSVQSWGGSISLKSVPGQGTTFRLRLPGWRGDPVAATSVPAARERAQTPEPVPAPKPARILIAEDEHIVSMVLGDCARDLGHHVEVVDSGDVAEQRLHQGGFDVAVLDLGIPGRTGDEVARVARARDPGLVTVLMTGWSLDAADRRLEAFDLALQKPFDARQAVQVLQEATRVSGQRRAEA